MDLNVDGTSLYRKVYDLICVCEKVYVLHTHTPPTQNYSKKTDLLHGNQKL